MSPQGEEMKEEEGGDGGIEGEEGGKLNYKSDRTCQTDMLH